MNQKIWAKVEEANNKSSGLARRYLHIKNFESAHNYTVNPDKGKPLSAYEFAKTITKDQDIACLNWLKDIVGKKQILHNQNFLLNQYGKTSEK